MRSIMLNNFCLFENFLDIINNEHYLITCTKYHSFNMNDAHKISPANSVGLPVKVVWPTMFFLKKKQFCMAFGLATGQPTWESAHEVHLNYNI